MITLRDVLETRQITICFGAVLVAALAAAILPDTARLESLINPALALMLFVTFLQVPLRDLGGAFANVLFFATLLTANFIVIPVFVALLAQFLPSDPLVQLGVLLVLLTPCIDYVVTFSHLGGADARLLLAATPALLILQMLLLPVYLNQFLGTEASGLVQVGPFVHAFVWLIALPLVCAASLQFWTSRSAAGNRMIGGLALFPVPATALVLMVVVAAIVPQLGDGIEEAVRVIPIYVGFAIGAPILGWGLSRLTRLDAPAGRAIAFSTATRNSLVVLPLALAVPGAIPIVPAVIVTQTLVELASELVYVRLAPRVGQN